MLIFFSVFIIPRLKKIFVASLREADDLTLVEDAT